MEIIYKSLSEIRPYEKNPRRNEGAVEKVANSIKEFGFKVPIIVDKEGVIVAGHTRYKAAQELELDKVPCLIAEDLTPEQVKAFRLADNKVAEFSHWDFELLHQELDDIEGLDMQDFGFQTMNEANIDDLFEPIPDEPEEEEKPEVIKCPHCGELIEL